jgi:hypothetical protein
MPTIRGGRPESQASVALFMVIAFWPHLIAAGPVLRLIDPAADYFSQFSSAVVRLLRAALTWSLTRQQCHSMLRNMPPCRSGGDPSAGA